MFTNNFRNSFTNQLPYFQEKRSDYGMSLGLIHIEKTFRTIGRDEKCFLLLQINYSDLDVNKFNSNTIPKHYIDPSYDSYKNTLRHQSAYQEKILLSTD